MLCGKQIILQFTFFFYSEQRILLSIFSLYSSLLWVLLTYSQLFQTALLLYVLYKAFVANLFHSTLCKAIGHIKLITLSYPQGYQAHLASTFSEWLMSICFLLYFLTFFREFRKIIVHIQVRPKNAEIFSSGEHDEARIVV